MDTIKISAPGKVMLCGAYVVLERPNPALVVSVSARFTVNVQRDNGTPGVEVSCPQISAKGQYDFRFLDEGGFELVLVRGTSVGAFVESALLTAVFAAYLYTSRQSVLSALRKGLRILVEGDEEFYTKENGKTGLGSSAAVVAATVAGICTSLGWQGDTHAASQTAHCIAQHKIGSGFDISAAVRGSQRYIRFPPGRIPLEGISARPGFIRVQSEACLDLTDLGETCDQLELPQGWDLVLGQVASGSSTPSMVKKVLSYKNSPDPDAQKLWQAVISSNNEVELAIRKGSVDESKSTFARYRKYLRELGDKSGAPIEPAEIRPILDETCKVQGVIHAGVPGAGGFDSICALIENSSARERVEVVSALCPKKAEKLDAWYKALTFLARHFLFWPCVSISFGRVWELTL
uniref:phosphomevalonate kinase n=1 Tax=Rhodosorus marinus TaxID=101924 RepID=A0A7S3EBE4_9RHOD|mmetsp:Transcript_23366/g.92905  ORF Transcript_23366/g.92905 Transcript_23366/m.92905 type:complete len:406 (+) Transcript_23366:150-1367(+)